RMYILPSLHSPESSRLAAVCQVLSGHEKTGPVGPVPSLPVVHIQVVVLIPKHVGQVGLVVLRVGVELAVVAAFLGLVLAVLGGIDPRSGVNLGLAVADVLGHFVFLPSLLTLPYSLPARVASRETVS